MLTINHKQCCNILSLGHSTSPKSNADNACLLAIPLQYLFLTVKCLRFIWLANPCWQFPLSLAHHMLTIPVRSAVPSLGWLFLFCVQRLSLASPMPANCWQSLSSTNPIPFLLLPVQDCQSLFAANPLFLNSCSRSMFFFHPHRCKS